LAAAPGYITGPGADDDERDDGCRADAACGEGWWKGHSYTGLEAPSPAPQQLSAASKRLHDVLLAAHFFFVLLNQSDAILQRDLHASGRRED
jgi:hypothetical protein|tara:strand:- start:356 stop:631 length:276 start_codon:yes stop_codon:yes gene_type:complete